MLEGSLCCIKVIQTLRQRGFADPVSQPPTPEAGPQGWDRSFHSPSGQGMAVLTLPQHKDTAAGEGHTKPPLLGNSCLLGVPRPRASHSSRAHSPPGMARGSLGARWGQSQAEGTVPEASSHHPAGHAVTVPSWRWLQASWSAWGCAVPEVRPCRTRAGAGQIRGRCGGRGSCRLWRGMCSSRAQSRPAAAP